MTAFMSFIELLAWSVIIATLASAVGLRYLDNILKPKHCDSCQGEIDAQTQKNRDRT